MSNHNIQFRDKIRSLNICFLELSEEFCWVSKTSLNLPWLFELLRFDCICYKTNNIC